VLTALIRDLGLTPDKTVYEALETPGLLSGGTLPERVAELRSLRREFSELPLSDLKDKLRDKRLRRLFYLVKGGEYRYTLINDYSYDKFSLLVDKILSQETDREKLEEFRRSLEAAGLPPDRQTAVLNSLENGRWPLPDPNRRQFSFEAEWNWAAAMSWPSRTSRRSGDRN